MAGCRGSRGGGSSLAPLPIVVGMSATGDVGDTLPRAEHQAGRSTAWV